MKTILITVLVSVVAAIIVSPVSGNSAAQASWSYELNNTSGKTLKELSWRVANKKAKRGFLLSANDENGI